MICDDEAKRKLMWQDLSSEIIRRSIPDLELQADGKHVGSACNYITRIFEFQRLKGDIVSPRWGVSIDFVPSLLGSRLVWKKHAGKAIFDLCIDPIDVSGEIPQQLSFRLQDSASCIEKAAAAAIEHAIRDWSNLSSLPDIVQCFEGRSKQKFVRFSQSDYCQTNLAWGLALAASGRADLGRRHIMDFCRDFVVPQNNTVLEAAWKDAISIAGGHGS